MANRERFRGVESGRCRRFAGGERGAALVELAVMLPILAVMLVGITDFGAAWVLKDKLAGAAREGARVTIGEFNDTTNPQCNGTPCSVVAGATATTAYLTEAGVTNCSLDPATATLTANGNFSWTYTSASGGNCSIATVTVARAVDVVSNGTNVLSTTITLTYPFSWNFAQVIKMIDPNSTLGNPLTFTTAEVMSNLD